MEFLDFPENNQLFNCVHKQMLHASEKNNIVETFISDKLFGKNVRLALSTFEKILDVLLSKIDEKKKKNLWS